MSTPRPVTHIHTIGIVGAGTMGSGIAQVALMAGLRVLLYDLKPSQVQRATETLQKNLRQAVERGKISEEAFQQALERFEGTTHFSRLAEADFVLEAVVEQLETKQALFENLDQVCPPDVVLASNTSSLPITGIAAATRRAELVVGMHFFNPAYTMKLVEVVRGHLTSPETISCTCALAERMGKVPVVVQDTPGFLVNRVARPFYGEALRIVGDGIATVEQVDRLVRAAGFRMGPFELMDLIGIDVNLAVTRSVYNAYFHEPRYQPHLIQHRMVQAGLLGRKSGRGFYWYSEPDSEKEVSSP
ncbi:MAG: 3-hydroxyacyl-CoA dehydrogenase NAD-binding domain-containing protein [Bacteroidetes bacterium]|nr:3-hydroxyacyl-CoA dehydrogenase NAD-binding domain-containing protein [Bacteroidota bacterium]